MCNDILYDITNDDCAFNLPGVTQLKYTLKKWANTLPALQDYEADPVLNDPLTLDGDITLDTVTYPTAQWFTADLEVDENGLKVDYNGKPGSGYYSSTIEGMISNVSRAAHYAVHKNNKSDLIVAVVDKTGAWRILGDTVNPAQFVGNYDGGKAPGDKVGFPLTVTWATSGTPPPFYDGVF